MSASTRFEYDDISQRGFCILVLREEPEAEDLEEFALLCGLMLASSQSKLILDLSRTAALRSAFIAHIVDLHCRADGLRKLLTLYVSPALESRLVRLGLDRIVRTVTVRHRMRETRDAEALPLL